MFSRQSTLSSAQLRRRTALPSELKAGRQRQFSDPPVRGTESAEGMYVCLYNLYVCMYACANQVCAFGPRFLCLHVFL